MKNKVEIIIVAMQIRTGIKTKCKKKKKKNAKQWRLATPSLICRVTNASVVSFEADKKKKKAFPTKEKKKDRAQIQPVSLSFSFNS